MRTVSVICLHSFQADRGNIMAAREMYFDELNDRRGHEADSRNMEHKGCRTQSASQSEVKHAKKLFTNLYLRQPDGSLTTALLPEDEVRRRWTV